MTTLVAHGVTCRKVCSNARGERGRMTLTFLGTRGNIDVRTRRHRRHTSTLVSHRGARVMIDCGADWLREVHRLAPDAIVLTHAHPDHVDGLRNGSPCPVYAPAAVWQVIASWPIDERHRLSSRSSSEICGIRFEVFPLDHSVNAPAAGYRIADGRSSIFYAPDVLRIRRAAAALANLTLYVGDGATIERPIVRIERQRRVPVGHASIGTQLDWCARAGVPRAIFTHCGRAIVAGPRDIEAQIAALGLARHVEARIAGDGLQIRVQ
jgi:phosphoribosyl 1,2-cyclic phosphodiesterase